MTWSVDATADDWTKISPAQVYSRALQGIEANGKGILLLHDIQAKTVEALPDLLRELKRRRYHIVHVVPATPDQPKTATVPGQWMMHAQHTNGSGSFAEVADTAVCPAPSPSSLGVDAHATVSMQPIAARRCAPARFRSRLRLRGRTVTTGRRLGSPATGWRKLVRFLTAWM